jgi:3-deoxy-manno-octulosonate cytidylyltransferase (CMP-KDO synthetase)
MQGDEPLLSGLELRKLCIFHLGIGSEMATLIRKRDHLDQDFENKNIVKVIYSEQSGICHYFSRSKIPYLMDDKSSQRWYQHIGIYSYRVDALERFSNSPQGFYETQESLEQLRALELGMKIFGLKTNAKLIGVDNPEDIEKVERVLTNG